MIMKLLSLMLTAAFAARAMAYGVDDMIYTRSAKYKVTGANLVTNGELKGASLDGWTATDATVASLSDVFTVLEDGGVSVNAGMNDLVDGMYQVLNIDAGTYVVTMKVRGGEPGHTDVDLYAAGNNYIFAYFNTDGALSTANGVMLSYGEGGAAIENCYGFTNEDFTELAFPVEAASDGKIVIDLRGLAGGIEIHDVECHQVQSVFDERKAERRLAWIRSVLGDFEWSDEYAGYSDLQSNIQALEGALRGDDDTSKAAMLENLEKCFVEEFAPANLINLFNTIDHPSGSGGDHSANWMNWTAQYDKCVHDAHNQPWVFNCDRWAHQTAAAGTPLQVQWTRGYSHNTWDPQARLTTTLDKGSYRLGISGSGGMMTMNKDRMMRSGAYDNVKVEMILEDAEDPTRNVTVFDGVLSPSFDKSFIGSFTIDEQKEVTILLHCYQMECPSTNPGVDVSLVDPVLYKLPAKEGPGAATPGVLVPVSYWDPVGETNAECEVYAPYVGENTLTSGWWVVFGAITNNTRITVSGEVHLLLADGAELTANAGIDVASSESLTIWAQSTNAAAGKLTASAASSGQAGIGGGNYGAGGTITINGGTVAATGGTDGGAGIGGGFGGAGGDVTINGGTVEATGGEFAEAIGGGYNNGNEGSLILDGMKVTEPAGTTAAGREAACRVRDGSTVKLEVCEAHEYEGGACKWCGAEDPVEQIEAEVSGWEGTYDGAGHGVTVRVEKPETGAVARYQAGAPGEEAPGGEWSTAAPLFTNACSNATVWVEISAEGYPTATNRATVTIAPAPLTITAKDQTHDYDGMPKGEGDTVYATPEEIAAKVEVEGLQGDDRLASLVLDGQATEPGTYTNLVPSAAQVCNGTNNVTGNYAISYVAGTLTVRTPVYTVEFVWHEGAFATNYPYGTAAADVAVPDDPENYTENGTNYAFTGWSPAAVADVTTNATYTAQYGIVPEVDVSCVVTANGDDDEMTLVLAGPDDCDGVADVAIYEWDNTGAEPVPGEVVWSTNGVALAEGAAELTVSIDTGVVLPGQLVVAAYLPNDKYSGATASNRVMGTSSIILTTESNYQVDDNIVLGLEAYNSTGDIAVTLWVSDGNGGLTEFDWECAVVENTVEVGELPAGEYVVTAVLAGDANYLGSTDTKSFRVDKLEPGLEAEAGETTEGEPVVVTATLGYDDCTGTVTVAVDGSEYVGDVVDGVAAVTIPDLAAGDYEATVTYSGDDQYLEASTNCAFTVAVARPFEEVDGVIWYYEPVGSNAMVTGIAEAHATGNLTMPDTLGGLTVTSVGIAAFHGMTNITGMVLAAGVKDIWRDAFMSCTGLTNVTMGAAVETIDRDAFSDCPGLTDVTIPNGVKVISTNAFNLSGLTNVTFGTGLTSIEQGAFGTCTNLTDVKIPDGVTSIGELAFYDNRSLTNVWLGTGIEYVGKDAFLNCDALATIWIPVEQQGTELLTDAGLRNGCERRYYGTQVVKFDANGGTCDTPTNEYTIGEAYGWLPVTGREGYDFTGWWDEAEGVLLTTNAIVTEFASRTVYARWALQAVLTVKAGRWGSAVAVIGGTTNTVAGGTTAEFRVPVGSRVEVRAVADAGFAVDGEESVEIASFAENVSVAFAFLPNPTDSAIRWKFSSTVGRYFAQVSIPAHAGYAEALEGLAFLFADRTNAVGEVYAQLWDAAARSEQGVLLTAEGVEYRGVALDAAAFAGLAEGGSALWGVSDETLAETSLVVPADERQIGLYVRKRVNPVSGNETAGEVENFLGYLTWTMNGTRYYLPIVEGGTNAVMATQPSQSSTVATGSGSGHPSASFYNVVFAANGGTGVMAPQIIAGGAKATLRTCAYKREGWLFLGWAKTKNGAVAYKDEASVRNLAKNGETVTLYARWAKKTYKVVFCRTYKSAKGTMKKQTFTYGKGKRLRKNTFTREGYKFKGWAKSKALAKKGKVAYKNRKKVKNLVKNGKTVKLYAVWKKEEK